MIRAASIVAASLCTINNFVKYCPEIVKKYISIRGIAKAGWGSSNTACLCCRSAVLKAVLFCLNLAGRASLIFWQLLLYTPCLIY